MADSREINLLADRLASAIRRREATYHNTPQQDDADEREASFEFSDAVWESVVVEVID